MSVQQVPSSWRPLIENPTTVQLFLDFYAVTKPPLSNSALECLVRSSHHHHQNCLVMYRFWQELLDGVAIPLLSQSRQPKGVSVRTSNSIQFLIEMAAAA